MTRATAIAPATIANLGVGFDVLGAALPAPVDRVVARFRREAGIEIARIEGDGGRLPRDPQSNTAAVAAAAVLERSSTGGGLELQIEKGVPIAGGLGSSAASAVAAALAADVAVGARLSDEELLAGALAGEMVASRGEHADNVAACLLGGIVLAPAGRPLRPVELPLLPGLAVAVLRPPLELATHEARAVLGATVPLATAVDQWGRLATFVAALHRGDWELLAYSLGDGVAEPQRAHLVPGFSAVKAAAASRGALGCSLAGAGPSIFALCRGVETAHHVGGAMAEALDAAAGLKGELIVNELAARGARVEPS